MSVTTHMPDLSRTVRLRPGLARAIIVLALLGGAVAGLALGARSGGGGEDADLLRLLRAMAAIKLLFVAAAAAVTLWRLQRPVSPLRLGAYAVACAATAVGPGLLWTSAHAGAAALLLHGGLAMSVLLLWQDPGTSEALRAAVARRRSAREA